MYLYLYTILFIPFKFIYIYIFFVYIFFAAFISSENSIIEVGISIGSFIVGIISGLTCGLFMFKLVQKKQLKYKQTPSVPIYEDIKLQDNPASEVEITPNVAYGQTMKK